MSSMVELEPVIQEELICEKIRQIDRRIDKNVIEFSAQVSKYMLTRKNNNLR